MKILLPVDGSSHSRGTLKFLSSRKTLLAEHPALDIINVQPPLPARAASLMSEEALAGYYEEESAGAFEASGPAPEGARSVRSSLVGRPSDVIAEEAEKRAADLIVMGSHGMSNVSELLFGSVTMGVLAKSKTPILILRDAPAPADSGVKVIFCLDGSEECRAAVKFALEHRALFGERPQFLLAHVSPTTVSSGAESAEAAGRNAFEDCAYKVRPLFADAGVVPEEAPLVGTPGDAIAAYANASDAGFLVMGNRGYGRIRSLLLGSTAIRIASLSRIPLLIVKG